MYSEIWSATPKRCHKLKNYNNNNSTHSTHSYVHNNNNNEIYGG